MLFHVERVVTSQSCDCVCGVADRVTLEVSRLWEDVEPEYHEIAAIRRRFERWRREQPESYNEAYIALCLPKLLTPFVRLKLVAWNPLEAS